MAASKAELWTQIANAAKIEDEHFKFCTENSPNLLDLMDTLQQSYEGDHIGSTNQQYTQMLSSLNQVAGSSTRMNALIIEAAQLGYDSISTQVSSAIDDIRSGMNAASETVRYRNWTFGSVSAGGGNNGDSTIYRLTKDKYDQDIESGNYTGGSVKIRIVNDKNMGQDSGREQAIIYGSGKIPTSNLDKIALGTAPAGQATITALRASDGLLNNASFDTYAETPADEDDFDSWKITSYSDATQNTSVYYRKQDGQTTGSSCEFTDNNDIEQHITDARARIDATKPVFLIVRYYTKTSCDGVLTVRLGSKTTQVADLTAVAATTWHEVILGNANNDGWYDAFKEDDSDKGFRVKISLSSNTTGELLIDEVILAQPTEYNKLWYMMPAGSDGNDMLSGDYWTFADTVANTGRIQATIARLYGKHFCHATSGETYADA